MLATRKQARDSLNAIKTDAELREVIDSLRLSDEESGRKVEAGRFDAMLECYSAGDDGAFDDMLSFLESAMSELVVNERGDRKKKAIDACKRLSCVR